MQGLYLCMGDNGMFMMKQALLVHNAKVYLAARSPARAQTAIDHLAKETGKEAMFLKLDLSDLTQVRRAANDFLK